MKTEEELMEHYLIEIDEVEAFMAQYPTKEDRDAFIKELAMPDPGEPFMDAQRPELN